MRACACVHVPAYVCACVCLQQLATSPEDKLEVFKVIFF